MVEFPELEAEEARRKAIDFTSQSYTPEQLEQMKQGYYELEDKWYIDYRGAFMFKALGSDIFPTFPFAFRLEDSQLILDYLDKSIDKIDSKLIELIIDVYLLDKPIKDNTTLSDSQKLHYLKIVGSKSK